MAPLAGLSRRSLWLQEALSGSEEPATAALAAITTANVIDSSRTIRKSPSAHPAALQHASHSLCFDRHGDKVKRHGMDGTMDFGEGSRRRP